MELFPETQGVKGFIMCRVSVVIPNYNGKQYLKPCLDSLERQEYEDLQVILVDNGSEDGSVPFVREHYPWVRLIALEENTGFCGAVNAGIRAGKGTYVILLNNDTVAERHFVGSLVNIMDDRPRAFSCQAKMLQMHDRTRMDDGGNYYCALGWAFAVGKGKPESEYDREKQIFSACAGAAIYRRDVLEEIGYFDEEHFAYLEDMDIGYRARLRGYENWYCPRARVLHVGSGTTGSRYNLFKVRYSSRNNIYLIYKNMPLFQIIWNIPFLAAGFGLKTLFFAKKGFGKEYVAGLKNGIAISRKNKDRKFKADSGRRYIQVQIQLYRNLYRLLKK